MPRYFTDSSALVKRYRNEDGSQRVSELLENAEEVLLARLGIVEVSSALVRRARSTQTPQKDLLLTLADFDEDLSTSLSVELDESVMDHAVRLSRLHGLRGADAIQLSCALLAKRDRDQEIILLSSDAELNAAAAVEGLTVVNPS
jgi:predicted nucleic acid-binding protein